MTPTSILIAKRLAFARHFLEINQEMLAARSGVSRATLIQVEQGTADPLLSTVTALAEALGLTLGELLNPPRPATLEPWHIAAIEMYRTNVGACSKRAAHMAANVTTVLRDVLFIAE